MKSSGKVFEEDFKDSCKKQQIFCRRLRDNPASFNVNKTETQFSVKQPYDFEMFRPDYDFLNLGPNEEEKTSGHLYGLELKSTAKTSITIQTSPDDAEAMIHYHQIKGLSDAKKYRGAQAGFVLNYRKEENCYSAYIYIDKFIKYINSTGKKSISFKNVLLYGGILLSGELKRTRYQYDVNKLINDIIAKEVL